MSNLPFDVAGVIIDYVDGGLGLAVLSEVNKAFAELVKERCVRPFRMNRKLIKTTPLAHWAAKHGIDVCTMFRRLAYDKEVEIIEELLKSGLRCSGDVVIAAADQGNLEFVKKVLLNGGPMSESAVQLALRGHLHVLQWLYENGYVERKRYWHTTMAWKSKHYDVHRWLIDNGWPSM